VAEGKTEKTTITTELTFKYLGPPPFIKEDEQEKDEIGVATGLAWTAVGGEILYVESTVTKGKGGILLTGQLGDIMKESGQAALGFIRSQATKFNINEDLFSAIDIHVHFPAGGIPKDGPSAGITMACAILSRLTHIAIRKDVAMTGEITLTGRVLPIGGLKEKVLAAMRHGIKKIIIPEKNKKDLEDIPEEYRNKLTFIPVKTFEEVIDFAFTQKLNKTSSKASSDTRLKEEKSTKSSKKKTSPTSRTGYDKAA
jgi:ATP-dependent Lon protease